MPIDIRDCDGGIGVIIEGRGRVSDQEYRTQHTRHLTRDRDTFSKYRYSLSDYTGVTQIDVTNESIYTVAELARRAAKGNPYVVVALVAANELAFGLSRMAEALLHGTKWEVMVKKSRGEAVDWIREQVEEKYGIVGLTFN